MNAVAKAILQLAKWAGYVEPVPVSYWQEKVIKFALAFPRKDRVILVGDSITEGWATTGYMDGCLNYGISGDTTLGVLGRINQVIKAEPRKVILNIGTNDIGSNLISADTLLANYSSILNTLCLQVGKEKIVVCAIRPINSAMPMCYDRLNTTVVAINEAIKSMCVSCGVTFEPATYTCNLSKVSGKDFLSPSNTTDGLHLNARGYDEEFKILKKYMP